MKEGWTYKKLGEITISMADGPFGSNLKAEHYTDHKEVRIIQLSNIGEEGWREENVKYTTFEHLESIKRSEVQPDDIVIAKMMPAGRAILCPHHEKKYVLSSDAVRATLVEGVDKKFILYSINSPYFRKQVYANVSGSGRVRTSLTKLRDCSIAIPSLEVQQRIVERLDAAFENIDKLKANAETQLAEARTLFQKSLAKAMEPKEGWEEKALGDVCTLSQGLAINSHTKHLFIQNGSLPLLRIKDMKEGTREIFVDEANCPQGCIASEEDIIYTRTGTLGLVFTGMHGVLHNNCFKIKHDINKLNKTFLIYFLRNDSFVKTIIGLASRAAQPDITHKLFKAQEIHFPALAEQQRIVERLDALSENIRKYEEIQRQIISECDALKQALLRKVFE